MYNRWLLASMMELTSGFNTHRLILFIQTAFHRFSHPQLRCGCGHPYTRQLLTDTRQLPPHSLVVKTLDDHWNVTRRDGSYLPDSWNFASVLNAKRLLPRKEPHVYSLFVACVKSPWFWCTLISIFPFLGKLFLILRPIWFELRSTEKLLHFKSSW